MKILIIGAYPPPIGGNSVHIKRLHEALSARQIDCDVIDLYGRPDAGLPDVAGVYRLGPANLWAVLRTMALIRQGSYDAVHFHVAAMDRFIYAGCLLLPSIPRRIKKIITVHSGQFVENFQNARYRLRLFRHVFSYFDHVIAVGAEQQATLCEMGVDQARISVIPAYLPPTIEASEAADQTLAGLRRDGRIVIISSGYGEPLYGYHTLAAAIASEPALKGRVSLLLCLYNKFIDAYMAELKSTLSELESVEILYDLKPEQFAYTLSKSDVYVRATDGDGDAVAIREAAHFGVPVIASDSVGRPAYCTLFKNADVADLALRLREFMEQGGDPKIATGAVPGVERIVEIYSQENL